MEKIIVILVIIVILLTAIFLSLVCCVKTLEDIAERIDDNSYETKCKHNEINASVNVIGKHLFDELDKITNTIKNDQ